MQASQWEAIAIDLERDNSGLDVRSSWIILEVRDGWIC